MPKSKYPKTLYVKHEKGDRSDPDFLVADANYSALAEANDSLEIAIYQLVRVTKVVNESKLSGEKEA